VADGEVAAEEADAFHQLHGRHAVLADDFVELDHVVGGVGHDGQAELVRGPAGGAEQIEGTRLDLTGCEQPAYAVVHAAVDLADEGHGALELLHPRGFVHDALETSFLVADPAARIVSGTEIGAQPKPLDLAQERLLHAELAAELHERGDAVSQHLGDREGCEQPVAGVEDRRRPGGPRAGR